MNTMDYQPAAVEAEAQAYWDEHKCFYAQEDLSREKYYCLSMFPYPSGQLHMGHVRNYTLGDVTSRYQRMMGKNVLHPIGWDAFGLPAENAAIQHQIAPAKWTDQNIDEMRAQLKQLGFSYDWSRELKTCDPSYYRWEQWLFLQLYKKGLAYKKDAVVNWDPVDQTVLANEQVIDGRGWRSGALIERRKISQWFLKITAYAEELLNDLDTLDGWPEQIRTMQRHWIGRSDGASVWFPLCDHPEKIEVFTTRIDTLMGVSFIAISPEHPLATMLASRHRNIKQFIETFSAVPVAEAAEATVEKTGILTGLEAIHPLTGEKIPVWIFNYVLMHYGTGAVMGVPAHDERDFEVAKSYQLPIKPVIMPEESFDFSKAAYTDSGVLCHSGAFDGLPSSDAAHKIIEALIAKNLGKKSTQYRLRDWGVSRQRYWGTPIPMIHCEHCGLVAVPSDDLPVQLPTKIKFSGAQSPLKTIESFYHVKCPSCHRDATRETDTFDTFVESSWYYARFACRNQDCKILDDRVNYWTPVDQYIGGIEHATMHLLYARFFHKVMRDLGLLNTSEPFIRMLAQGMVLKDGSKMSKSKGNTVNPNELIEKFGADTVRLFTMFAAPPEQSLEWSDAGVEGAYRFLRRLWTFALTHHEKIKDLNITIRKTPQQSSLWSNATAEIIQLRRQIHEILQQARYDYDRLQFNTIVSAAMKLLNTLHDVAALTTTAEEKLHLLREGISILLRILAPIVPHITHSLWLKLGFGDIILNAKFPKVSSDALKTERLELIIQINGKKRGKIAAGVNDSEAEIMRTIQNDPHLSRVLANQTIIKTVIVPHKLVNLVVRETLIPSD